MIETFVSIADIGRASFPTSSPSPGTDRPLASDGVLIDRLGRPLTDLRISVTDRCNFRCSYCMPKEVFDKNHRYVPHAALLSFEEITRLARLFAAQGVRKIRLTGGEPLLRKDIERLVEQLAALRTPDGLPLDLTLTTNGSLLARKAKALKAAGLNRVTVSLDALDDAVFRRMNDVDFPVADVLAGIDAALDAGLGPVKINMVVKGGTNAQEIVPMARHFRGSGATLRFIEYMDVGATNGWRMHEVVPSAEVVRRIAAEFPLVALEASAPGETAQRWGYADAEGRADPALGEIGVISSVTRAFCGDCSRARLSTEGRLYLCLFGSRGHDLRPLVREQVGADGQVVAAASDERILQEIAGIWRGRADRYSELRASRPPEPAADAATPRRVEMSYIGG
ncbi:MAG: GTP 3',8-cyclase MoaA [Variovorax sp.]|jgi:cyclic pyranopterin phosphate synthase|nr:MAG: GTP 3',8-cyclase MoaA [Variovorax sp.]